MSAWIATSNEATSERMNCVFHFLQLSSLWMSLPQSPSSSSSSSSSSVAIVYRILMCSVSYVLPPFCCQHAQALIRTLSWHPGRMRVLPKWVGLCPDIVIEFGFCPAITSTNKILMCSLSYVLSSFSCPQVQALGWTLSWHGSWIQRVLPKWVGFCPDIVIEFGFYLVITSTNKILRCSLSYVFPPFCCQQVQT